jgi:hypothetical protein
LFSNCNLLDDIPKVNGFFSLFLREGDQVVSLLYASQKIDIPHLLDFLNVSHITAPDKLFDWETRTNCLAFVTAGQQPLFADEINTLQALSSPEFTPREIVYLPIAARPLVKAHKTPARVLASHFTAQRGEIDTETSGRSVVVISQADYHLWRAFVDGQPARLWHANHAFQAVEVSAGRHQIRLVYHDPFFNFGAAVAVGSLICAIFLINKKNTESPSRS